MTPNGLLRLKDDEGCRLHLYLDTAGVMTIGYGRNLISNGISPGEATMMLANDVAACESALSRYPWFVALDPNRQDAVVNVAYNLGVAGFLTFRKTIAALAQQDYEAAAAELLDSDAARELPNRYGRLATVIRTGAASAGSAAPFHSQLVEGSLNAQD